MHLVVSELTGLTLTLSNLGLKKREFFLKNA